MTPIYHTLLTIAKSEQSDIKHIGYTTNNLIDAEYIAKVLCRNYQELFGGAVKYEVMELNLDNDWEDKCDGGIRADGTLYEGRE